MLITSSLDREGAAIEQICDCESEDAVRTHEGQRASRTPQRIGGRHIEGGREDLPEDAGKPEGQRLGMVSPLLSYSTTRTLPP